MTPAIPIPQTPPDDDRTRIVERPDGFYWQDKSGDELYGPFATLLEALQDMQAGDDTGYGEGESLQEAEAEIGMSVHIDPETGQPAESSQPHLSDQ
jgi:hypothetical protein